MCVGNCSSFSIAKYTAIFYMSTLEVLCAKYPRYLTSYGKAVLCYSSCTSLLHILFDTKYMLASVLFCSVLFCCFCSVLFCSVVSVLFCSVVSVLFCSVVSVVFFLGGRVVLI